MSNARWWMGFVTMSLFATTAMTAKAARAAESPVALAEISIADSARALAPSDVRDLAEGAIGRAAWPKGRRGSLVSVSIVSVEARPSADGASGARLSCVVSAALRDKRTGNVYAVVESRATREQSSLSVAEQRVTVGAALESAISRLPGALR